jgi:hypothetical protein
MKPKSNRVPAPSAPGSPSGDHTGLAQKFMRDNPVGKLTDPPEIAEGREKPFAGDVLPTGGETPEQVLAETLGTQIPLEGVESSTAIEGSAAGETRKEATPPPTPQAETKPAEQPAAQPAAPAQAEAAKPAEPQVAKIDREAKYELLPGHEWTGDQILAGLQQRAELAPKAEETDKFRSLLGGEYAEAEARWKPVLEKLAANPQRTQFLEAVLATEDPAALDYLARSLAFYNQEVPADQRPAAAAPQAPAAAANPEIQAMRGNMQAMEDQLMARRFIDERREIHGSYAFLNHDEAAKKALYEAAAALFATDAAAGKPALQRRGLVEAAEQLKVFLEAKQAVFDAQRRPSRVEPNPQVGAQALLPGTGPGAAGTARPAPSREYRGDPDKAKDQFLQDYPD